MTDSLVVYNVCKGDKAFLGVGEDAYKHDGHVGLYQFEAGFKCFFWWELEYPIPGLKSVVRLKLKNTDSVLSIQDFKADVLEGGGAPASGAAQGLVIRRPSEHEMCNWLVVNMDSSEGEKVGHFFGARCLLMNFEALQRGIISVLSLSYRLNYGMNPPPERVFEILGNTVVASNALYSPGYFLNNKVTFSKQRPYDVIAPFYENGFLWRIEKQPSPVYL